MGIGQWIREGARDALGVETRSLSAPDVAPLMPRGSSAGPIVTPRGALAIADAYACVRALADAAASLPLHVYRRQASGGRQRVEGPVADLLERPAHGMSRAVLVAQMLAHLNLFGECFVGKWRGPEGYVEQLGLVEPARVSIEQAGGLVLYTVPGPGGVPITVGPEDVLHVRGLTLDGLRGLSPVAQARDALGMASELVNYGASTFAHDAVPRGIFKVPAGGGSDDLKANLRAGVEGRHGGTANAGRVGVVDADVEFIPTSMPLADAQWIAARELSTREVARVFRVPPWIIGADAGSSLTYATVSEQARAFVTFSLSPWLAYIEAAFATDADLCPLGSGTYVAFDLDGLLAGDAQARSAVYTAALNPSTGWMTRAEIRELEDLPAEPDPPTPAPEPPASPVPTPEEAPA